MREIGLPGAPRLGSRARLGVWIPWAEKGAQPSRDRRSLSVLVVDDDRDSADGLADLLQQWGHEVHVAYDGPAAIDVYKTERPDVVLLDIGLPEMDGYEIARSLSAQEHRAALFALTGQRSPQDRRNAFASGFTEHFAKPINTRLLRELLSRF